MERNFTDTGTALDFQLRRARKDVEDLQIEVSELRLQKSAVEMEIDQFRKKCSDDVVKHLRDIPEVTKAFRLKIDGFIPEMLSFQISCPGQRDMLEQIQYNCSSLSREVENKFRPYLDHVGAKVSDFARRLSREQSNKTYVLKEMFECKRNLTLLKDKNERDLREVKIEHDKYVQQVLMEKKKLRSEKELAERQLRLKNIDIEHLNSSNSGQRVRTGICNVEL